MESNLLDLDELRRKTMESDIEEMLTTAHESMQVMKPNDRSEKDRLWAILLTDLQKLKTLYRSWIIHEEF